MSKRSVAKCLGLVISLFGVGLSQPSIVYAQCGPSDISGTVYRDFDSDGERDAFEPGVIGISVAAYDDSNTQVASASTAADGSYQLSAVSSSVRIEFSSLPSYLYSGQAGTDSFTTVAFAAPGACDQDLAVGNPAQYCQDNPDLAIACFVGGDPVAGGNLANRDTLVTVPL